MNTDTLLFELCAEPDEIATPSVGSNPFQDACWVARAVYGVEDGRWLQFRAWLLGSAPAWFRELYLRHGPAFADWLADKPLMKILLRRLMDRAIRA